MHVLQECSTNTATKKKATFGVRNVFAVLLTALLMTTVTAFVLYKLLSSDSYAQHHFS